MTHILAVDDAPEVQILVKGILEAAEFTVSTASNGTQALHHLSRQSPDLLLLDIDLPDIDGLTLCRQLRKDGKSLPIIMLTAHRETHDLANGLDCGADDYIGKPFAPEELVARVKAQLRREERLKNQVQDLLKAQWDRINDGLSLAQRIQQPLAASRSRHLGSSVHYFPVGRIGGDFYLIEDLDDEHCLIVIGDTMGRGLGASLVMSWTLSVLHEHAFSSYSPSRLLNEVNLQVGRSLDRLGIFVALFCGVYNVKSRSLTYCTAGHDPPILISSENHGRRHHRLSTQGLPIGVMPEVSYNEYQIQARGGDRLFLFTDGLTDAVEATKQPALFRSIYRTLLKTMQLDIHHQTDAVMQTSSSQIAEDLFLPDDVTMLIVELR